MKTGSKTTSEGLAGFIAFKSGVMPEIEGEQFVFENVNEKEFEQINTEYVTGICSQVQQMVVQCGKKRRSTRSSNNLRTGK